MQNTSTPPTPYDVFIKRAPICSSQNQSNIMGFKTWNREGPSVSQFGSILLNFVGMLVVKICLYLVLKKAAGYFKTFYARYTKGKEKEAGDKKQTDEVDKNQCNSSASDEDSEVDDDWEEDESDGMSIEELEQILRIGNKTKMKRDRLIKLTEEHKQQMSKNAAKNYFMSHQKGKY